MPSAEQSKLLSYVLRHKPEEAGVTLGPGGWVPVDQLLSGLAGMGSNIDLQTLYALVDTSEKKRFTLSKDKALVRAAQGHSVAVDLQLPQKQPPQVLFHGTATRFLGVISEEGLLPISRQLVHLSLNENAAADVGARHGVPVVIQVAANEMARDGHAFFEADNGVWLTASVPPQYLALEERT